MTSGLHSASYLDQLKEVNLTTLEERRIRGDLIQTWKILHKHDNVQEGTWFTRSVDTAQRETRFSMQYEPQLKTVQSRYEEKLL